MSLDDPTMSPPIDAESPATAQNSALSLEVRQKLVQQFEQWLDRMQAGEPPPAGLPEEILADAKAHSAAQPPGEGAHAADLYTLFSGLTTLSGEVRLQGRAFRQLTDTLAPLATLSSRLDNLESAQAKSLEHLAHLRDEQQGDDVLHVSGKEVCGVLVDLYDRLQRGLTTCDHGIQTISNKPQPGWIPRLLGCGSQSQDAIQLAQALRDAYALTLARLESVLHDWGIQRIGQVGEKFDPQRMTAVQIRPAAGAESETVLEVNRSGYAVNGRVLATAQVTVAGAASR